MSARCRSRRSQGARDVIASDKTTCLIGQDVQYLCVVLVRGIITFPTTSLCYLRQINLSLSLSLSLSFFLSFFLSLSLSRRTSTTLFPPVLIFFSSWYPTSVLLSKLFSIIIQQCVASLDGLRPFFVANCHCTSCL